MPLPAFLHRTNERTWPDDIALQPKPIQAGAGIGMAELEGSGFGVTDCHRHCLRRHQMSEAKNNSITRTSLTTIESMILIIRGERVILDSNLAVLYGVSTMRLNEQVKRNRRRFPADFMFRLTKAEWDSLISQFATSKAGRGGRRKLPYVFTAHGAIMAANVLSNEKAIEVSVQVVRAFVRLRQLLASDSELARNLDELEKRYDHQFRIVFEAVRQLMTPSVTKARSIGFRPKTLKN